MLTRNQKFAVAVHNKVSAHKGLSKADKDKYGAMAQKLPVLIRTAGLAQAVSFLEAKSQKDTERMNRQLLNDLAATVGTMTGFAAGEFANRCRSAELTDYLQLTNNTLAALLWFKRFSVSVLEVAENADTKQ